MKLSLSDYFICVYNRFMQATRWLKATKLITKNRNILIRSASPFLGIMIEFLGSMEVVHIRFIINIEVVQKRKKNNVEK